MGSSIAYVHSWTQGRVYVCIGSIVFYHLAGWFAAARGWELYAGVCRE